MPSLGFGIERLGLIPIRYPWHTLVFVVALTAVSVMGLFNLQPEGRLSETYRGSSLNYASYDKISKAFPATEFDVYLLLTGKDLLSRENIDKLSSLVQDDVQFSDGVAGTLSIFSLRGTPDATGYSEPLFPADISSADDATYKRTLDAVEHHPDIYGKMLTRPEADGSQTMLVVVSLEEDAVKEGTLWGVLDTLAKTAHAAADPAGLKIQFAGAPYFQQEIRNAINHDVIFFNLGGLAIGVFISIWFLRRHVFVIMSSMAAVLANVWLMGILGYFGQTVNAFITIIPPLVMVITVSDGTHLILDIYRQLREGVKKEVALRHSVLTVGPACVLTSLTTTIAMLSMVITDSAVIRSFGLSAALGTMIAFIAVIVILPMMSMLAIRDESKFRGEGKSDPAKEIIRLEKLTARLSNWLVPRWRPMMLLGIVMWIGFTWMHMQLQPRYSMTDEIPIRPDLEAAMSLVNDKLGGGDSIEIYIGYGKDRTVTSPDTLEAIGEAHRLLASLPNINEVSSLEHTRKWFHDAGVKNPDALQSYIKDMPDFVKHRFFNEEQHAAIVVGKIRDLQTEEIRTLVARIEPVLNNMREEYPGFDFEVSGLSTLAALQSTNIISQLNNSLLAAIIFVIALIGVAFRSFKLALLSGPPNLFPIVAAGAVMYMTDGGLQYASVLGLTIAFGLAVDDTIHFFNRYEQEKREGLDDVERVKSTLWHIGPVLVLTTLILIFGLSVTILSDLKVTNTFGQLSMATLAAALIADMIFVPAMLIGVIRFERWWQTVWRMLGMMVKSGGKAPEKNRGGGARKHGGPVL